MAKEFTEDDVRLTLLGNIGSGTQKAFADRYGLTPGYVGDVVNGRRKPGPAILKALGLEVSRSITMYRRIKK